MEASVYIDMFGWVKTSYNYDVEIVTYRMQEIVVSSFEVPVKVDVLLKDVNADDYDALLCIVDLRISAFILLFRK